MPTVPSYGGAQAAPSGASNATFAAPQEINAAPGQLMQAGAALEHAGTTAANIATDMQQQVNQVRVDDGLNKIRQAQLDLTYNPQSGYKNLKGDAALTRPDGVPLEQEYGAKLATSISTVSASLGNEAQRRAFSMQANDLATQFQAGVQQHKLGEYRDYALSTQDGTIKLGMDQAERNWNNPDMVKSSLESVKAAAYRMGSLKGLSGSEIVANTQQMTSAVHERVISAAIQANNPTAAMQYLQQNKGEMTAGDILKTNLLVNHDLDGRISMNAVAGASAKLAPQIAPTNMDRLTSIVQGMESKGVERNPDGSVLTSPKGAKGSMQVMDPTNGNPGYGVTPARDGSDAERKRVGQDYLAAMVKQYGNPAQALAAYNAGPGRLDEAIAEAKKAGTPEKWLALLPKETQGYVANGMDQLGKGGGAPPFPTESAFVQAALAHLGENPRIEQVKMTREQAVAQYTMLDKSRKEQGEQAVKAAQQALIQNGGSFAALSPQLKSDVTRYAPEKFGSLTDFAGDVANPVRQDNFSAYNQAVLHVDELAKMSDATFEAFIHQNFTQRTAHEVVKLRDDEMNGKIDTGPQSINRPAVTRSLNQALENLKIPNAPTKGMPWTDEQKERLGGIQKFVDDSIFAAQKQSGKKMMPAEIQQHIGELFAKDATFKNTLWYGGHGADTSQRLMALTLKDVPVDSVNTMRAKLIQYGNKAPTDTEIVNLYRRTKLAQQQ